MTGSLPADPSGGEGRARRISSVWQGEDAYGAVLLLLLGSIALYPLSASGAPGRLLVVATLGGTMILALRTSGVRGHVLAEVLAVLVVAVFLTAATGVTESEVLVGVITAAVACFYVVTGVAILRRIIVHRVVTQATMYGALCVYLLLGMLFATLYMFVDLVEAGAFYAQIDDPTPFDNTYFSFVTLATLGYGDLSPATETGRSLAILEAIIGQIFLVTAVARVVSSLGADRTATAEAARGPAVGTRDEPPAPGVDRGGDDLSPGQP